MQAAVELNKILLEYGADLEEMDNDKANFRSSPGKWSKKEILGHLVDSAQNNIRRFIVAQYENKPVIVYDQEEWVRLSHYGVYDFDDLLSLWKLLNRHIIGILEKMDKDQLERIVVTSEPHNVEWLAFDYNKHLLHHLHVILDMEPYPYP